MSDSKKPTLGDILHRIRHTRGGDNATRAAFGRKIDVSGQFIGLVERGRKKISPKVAHRIAENYGRDDADKAQILRQLLSAHINSEVPNTNAADVLIGTHPYLYESSPSRLFTELLRSRIPLDRSSMEAILDTLLITQEIWQQVLDGVYSLSPAALSKISPILGVGEETLRLYAGYLPCSDLNEIGPELLLRLVHRNDSTEFNEHMKILRENIIKVLDHLCLTPEAFSLKCDPISQSVLTFINTGSWIPVTDLIVLFSHLTSEFSRVLSETHGNNTPAFSSNPEFIRLFESLASMTSDKRTTVTNTLKALIQSLNNEGGSS